MIDFAPKKNGNTEWWWNYLYSERGSKFLETWISERDGCFFFGQHRTLCALVLTPREKIDHFWNGGMGFWLKVGNRHAHPLPAVYARGGLRSRTNLKKNSRRSKMSKMKIRVLRWPRGRMMGQPTVMGGAGRLPPGPTGGKRVWWFGWLVYPTAYLVGRKGGSGLTDQAWTAPLKTIKKEQDAKSSTLKILSSITLRTATKFIVM